MTIWQRRSASRSTPPTIASDGNSPRGKTAQLLLILPAVLAAYFGLSSLLQPFVGTPDLYTGIAHWAVSAVGALQFMAAAAAFVLALCCDLRGATFASAACLLLGWLEALPPVIRHGLDFSAGAALSSTRFVALPMIALSAVALAGRNSRPILAVFIVTAPVTIGLLMSIALAITIAIYGF